MPDTIYHYTSLQGMLGIINEKAIWSTDSQYLNDSSEFDHIIRMIRSQTGQIYEEDDYLSGFAAVLCDAIAQIDADEIFVTSFSTNRDLLSQWRGYCNNGIGVCIGFDFALLNDYCESNGMKLLECVYDIKSQSRYVENILNQTYSLFPMPKITKDQFLKLDTNEKCKFVIDFNIQLRSLENDDVKRAVNKFTDSILQMAPIMKNQSFSEEQEWRIVAVNPKIDKRFRVNNTNFIPYISIPVFESIPHVINEVIVGPNPVKLRCVESLKKLLNANGYIKTRVAASVIPYMNA